MASGINNITVDDCQLREASENNIAASRTKCTFAVRHESRR